jgi:ABC-type glycerol-3-phosphate transport system permease component
MFLVLLPVVFLVLTSFKSSSDVMAVTAFLPRKPTLENYSTVIRLTPFPRYVMNSLIVAVAVMLGTTIMSSMAAYVVARYRRRHKILDVFARILLLLQMFPLVLSVIPLYRTFLTFRLLNTRAALILASGTFAMPFSIWLLINFFEASPREIEESGAIDGCNRWQVFWRLVFPVCSTGIASVAIISFMNSWNEFMMANILTKDENIRTLPVGITVFVLQFTSQWGALMAASTMTMVPVAFFLVFAQKYLVQGLTAGSIKG